MSSHLLYDIREGVEIPEAVSGMHRWSRLKESLWKVLDNSNTIDTISVGFPQEYSKIKDYTPEKMAQNCRQAVYNWATSPDVDLKSKGLIAKTRAVNDPDSGRIWVYVWLERTVDTIKVPTKR